MKLTPSERITLIHLLRVQKLLDPDNEKNDSRNIKILEGGYECCYREIDDLHDPLSEEDTEFVKDTLWMFHRIAHYIEDTNDEEVGGNPASRFRGFDSSEESDLARFATFIVSKDDFNGVWKTQTRHTWSSHVPMREIYIRMLELWEDPPVVLGARDKEMIIARDKEMIMKVLSVGLPQ